MTPRRCAQEDEAAIRADERAKCEAEAEAKYAKAMEVLREQPRRHSNSCPWTDRVEGEVICGCRVGRRDALLREHDAKTKADPLSRVSDVELPTGALSATKGGGT